jgi:heme/copper-type cytochrome/quinol oxidase subunit 1
MALQRIPLFAWAMLVTSFMVIFAMPAVMFASTSLITDRLVGTHFFNQAEGGDSVLWQHLFWFFGHPEVYIIFVPARGMMSSIISTFARRPVFGHLVMVLSLVTTGFLGFGLWVHHMFATDVPELGKSFFTAVSMMIAIPTALQILNWTVTLWTGKLVFRTPLLFVLAFFPMHILGLRGMPRRVYPYPTEMGWGELNFVATLGATTIALSVALFVVNVVRSLRHGAVAGDNPWNGPTLEWATASPPGPYNFARIPVVGAREPLWDPGGIRGHVTGLAYDKPELLVTSVVDAEPDHRFLFPTPSLWPFLTAVATTVMLVASIFTPWAVVWGAIPVVVTMTGWFWPKRRDTEASLALERKP